MSLATFFSVSALVGCAPAPVDAPAPAPAAPSSSSSRLLATVDVQEGHTVKFYQLADGATASVEEGLEGQHEPILTAALKDQSLSDRYRALTPAGTTVPAELIAADARAAGRGQPAVDASPAAPAETHGAGPEFYNDGEQQWFRNTFCNGATVCSQHWDWSQVDTNRNISWANIVAMDGSEGSTNAAVDAYWWRCDDHGPFGIFGSTCWWQNNYHAVVVPGHWISYSINNAKAHYRFSLTGAGGGTQISQAATFN
jgi:hypothetical protein